MKVRIPHTVFAPRLPVLFSTLAAGLSFVLFWTVLCILTTPGAFAQVQPQDANQEQAKKTAIALQDFLKENGNNSSFTYEREGRPDPFLPFITKELLEAEAEAKTKLRGMQLFEPGQLSLVAIVFSDDGPLAMVQDSAGKGYVLRKGTRIGRSGEVVNIASNVVTIKQLSYSLTDEKRYKMIEMVLKKEGEKQR